MSRTMASGWISTGCGSTLTSGTPDKRFHPKSPRFGRPRIGQFGIGKFATLSACERFVVFTQRGPFAAEVVFDKEAWESADDRWDLPMRLVSPDPARGQGTTVTLSHLRRRFDQAEVERRVIDSVPLGAPDFAVFLNGRRVMPLRLSGNRIPVLEGTPFGTVHGKIVIVPVHLASTTDVGIEIKVRQVTVRRDLFGMNGRDTTRIKGEVHADFLPVTADRTGFVRDTDEYRTFLQVMERVMAGVWATLSHLSDRTERQKSRQAVREAFRRIRRALAKTPDLSPFGPVSYAQPSEIPGGGAGVLSEAKVSRGAGGSAEIDHTAPNGSSPPESSVPEPTTPPAKRRRWPRVRRLTLTPSCSGLGSVRRV